MILVIFENLYLTRYSVVMQLRCDGIFSNHFITDFPQNVPVKNCENRSIFGKDMDKSCGLDHSVCLYVPVFM